MLLSIVICNHNYAQFLDGAITSAFEQSYPHKEIIVIDDGSTDRSADIIRRWNDKIVPIFQENQGQIAAYNRGFYASHGAVVIFLDADDTLDSNACSKIVAAFDESDVVKVQYKLRLVDATGRALGTTIPRRLSDGDMSLLLLNRGMLYDSSPGSGNAYRRDALDRLMPLPEAADDSYGADFFAVLGISLLGRVRAIGPEPLGSYRLHVKHATDQILFGNAGLKEPLKSQRRYERLKVWVLERLGPGYRLPTEFVDFSIQKQVFADTVFGTHGYFPGLRSGSEYLTRKLARSIWQRSSSLRERAGLTAWALAVLILPRNVGRPIARYVCNPASRGVGKRAEN